MLQCACREAKALTQRAKQLHCPVPCCPVSVVVPSRPELRRDGTGCKGQDTLLFVTDRLSRGALAFLGAAAGGAAAQSLLRALQLRHCALHRISNARHLHTQTDNRFDDTSFVNIILHLMLCIRHQQRGDFSFNQTVDGQRATSPGRNNTIPLMADAKVVCKLS